MNTLPKIDINSIAEKLVNRGYTSLDKNIDDRITEELIDALNVYLMQLTNEVLAEMNEVEYKNKVG